MRKINFLAMTGALAGVMMLGACSVNDDINEHENQPVRFTAGIGDVATLHGAPVTKAAGTSWAATDEIGIFMMQSGSALAANKQYNLSNASTGALAAEPGHEMYYPMDGSTVGFIAYYPYETGAALATPINVTIGDQRNQPAFDLLYSNNGTGSKSTATPVNLEFDHKLAKIVMNTTAGTGVDPDLTGMTVTIKGMNTKNTFALATGTLGTATTPAAITPQTLTAGSAYDAIIMPGSYAASAVTVEFTVGSETFTWTLLATTFEGGNEYTYTVTLTRTGVSVTGTINPWTEVSGGSETAE